MKNGNCPLCKSKEVYMTENKDNLRVGTVEWLFFSAGEGRASAIYYFDTTAIFAKASAGSPGLSSLKKCQGVEKSGVANQPAGRIACWYCLLEDHAACLTLFQSFIPPGCPRPIEKRRMS